MRKYIQLMWPKPLYRFGWALTHTIEKSAFSVKKKQTSFGTIPWEISVLFAHRSARRAQVSQRTRNNLLCNWTCQQTWWKLVFSRFWIFLWKSWLSARQMLKKREINVDVNARRVVWIVDGWHKFEVLVRLQKWGQWIRRVPHSSCFVQRFCHLHHYLISAFFHRQASVHCILCAAPYWIKPDN